MKIKAVIFDLDGVLTDTAGHHYTAWKEVAQKLGLELTLAHNEKLKGVSRTESLELILKWANTRLSSEEKMQLLEEKNTRYLESIDNLSASDILPGVPDFLETISSMGMAMAVGSSSKNARFILRKIGLERKFDVIVDGSMVERTKPDPEVFIKAAGFLGKQANQCLVIEDAPAGVEAGKKAGMWVWGLGDPSELGLADICTPGLQGYSIHNLTELLHSK
jgi:beta-phosphoglucomutase